MVAAVLAAGESQRFGSPKPLAVIDGRPMLQWVIDAIGLDRIFVVFGAHDFKNSIKDKRIEWIENPDFKEGMGSSLRALTRALPDDDLLLTLADLPFVRPEDYRILINSYMGSPVAAAFDDSFGPPCILPSTTWRRFQSLASDQGAKKLLKDISTVSIPGAAWDIDSPESLEKHRRSYEQLISEK